METTKAQQNALARAAKIVGGQAALAHILGYTDRRNVYHYFRFKRPVKAEQCPTIERVTRMLGNPVLCEELRPDVEWHVLRVSSLLKSPTEG